MPNYNKSFNFRNGVQVDEDNFYINANGLVGIGTTIPRYTLDLHGDASISGLVTTRSLNVSGVATFNQISVGNSITLYASSGIVSAFKFYGDGSTLSNIPTSQWSEVDPTAIYKRIYSTGTVGIGTTNPSLPYILTIGQNPDTVNPAIIPSGGVGINSFGSIKATGIITAGQFSGSGGGIIDINATNISSGTLSNARLPSQINLATGIATIRDVVVSSGATISGISTFTIHGLVTKGITALNLNLTGVSTVSSTFEISTTGLLRFSGAGGISIDSNSGTSGQFLISKGSGASGGVAWSNDISLSGIATVGLLTANNIWSSGFTTTSSLRVTGDATIDTLNIRRIVSSTPLGTNDITRINSGIITTTTLKSSFSETGITTSTSVNTANLDVSETGTIAVLHSGNVRLNVDSNTLNTVSGDLKLKSATGTVNFEETNLTVGGSSILTGITTFNTGLLPDENLGAYIGSSSKAFSEAHIDDVRIGTTASNQIDTRSGNLVLDSTGGTVNVKDDLDVDFRLIVDGSSTLSGIATFDTGILPDVDNGAYIGSSSKAFSEAHIDDVNIGFTLSNEINTRNGNLILNSTAGTVQVDDNLDVTGQLTVTQSASITGTTTLSDSLLPVDSTSVSIGSTTNRFIEAHIDDIRLGASATNEIDTRSGNLVLDSTGGTVEVDDNLDVNQRLNVDGNVYLSGITTVATSLLPNVNDSVAIGSTSKAFSEAHIDELQIGLPSAVGIISTRSGNLSLDSFTRRVTTSQDLSVGRNIEISGIATVTGNLRTGANLIPSTNINSSIGSTSLRFAEAHIDDVRLGFSGDNEIDTRSGNLILDSTGGTVEVDDNLDVNNALNVDGNVYLSGITTVATSLLPNTNANVPLGSSTKTFNSAYIDNIQIGVNGVNEIDTSSGNLILDSTGGTVEVDDNLDVNNALNVDGNVYLSGITTVGNNIVPNSAGASNLGLSGREFGAAYIASLQLGVNANEITTKSGDLNLKSFTNLINLENNVIISNNLRVAGLTTFAQVVTANNGILPTSDLGSFIGSATTAFGNAHIGNVNIASGENNTISTKSGDLKLTSNSNITRVLKKLIVDELSELTGIASVGTGIIPTSDKSGYLGSSSYAFGTAHINNIRIAVASTSTIDTISGDLVLQSNSNYVQVNDNLVVGGGLTVTNNVSAGPLFVNSSNNRIGVGTLSPETNFDVVSSDDNVSVLIKTSSVNNFPTFTLTSGTSSANIIFNELQDRTLKIRNQTPGPIVYQLHSGAAGVGTGNHTWKYKDTDLMSLTYGGKLGIGRTNPLETFEVVGTSTVTSNSFVGGDLKVAGDVTIDGDLIVDFGTNLNLNVGIVTASRIISISSITSANTFVNDVLYVNNLSNRTVGNGITFNSPVRFNSNTNNYSNINVNSGYNLNVYDSGNIVVSSNVQGASIGTASTISTNFVSSNSFYGNLFDGTHLIVDSAQVGIITVTNLDVTGVSTVSFYDLTANSLSIDSNTGVFIGQPVTEDGVENFVGIGTTQKIGGVSLYSSGTVLSPKFVAGITTITQNTNIATAAVAILSGDLLLDDGNIVINNGGNISIGNSSPSTEICSINDSYGKTIIGIGTTSAKAVIDFSGAGSGISTVVTPVGLGSQMKFMIPPSITSSERVGLATVEGAFIFNKSTKKHQMYDGTAWHDMY
jgi:hypothetical protein